MSNYTFSQLEALWINAGGSKALAPYAAATAEIESSGNPQAYNPSGASGLWQIEIPSNESFVPGGAANVFSPTANATAAVGLSGNSLAGLISNWTNWETQPNGAPATQAYVESIITANGSTFNATATGTTSGTGSTGTSSTAATLSSLNTGSIFTASNGVISDASTLLYDASKTLNFFFQWFNPGQGWRAAMGVSGVLLAGISFKSYTNASASALPLAIITGGSALMLFYMAFRPWPLSSGKPIRPAAYVVDILKGTPPGAGPAPSNDTDAIEIGLAGVLAIWGANKAAGVIGNVAQAAGSLLGNSGSANANEESEAETDLGEAETDLGDLGDIG